MLEKKEEAAMLYPFSALLARMKYITRWSLMHSTRAESLSEHTCDTALLAHMLCLIARRYTGTPCRPKTVAVAALYHDAPEIITGDMPTPVKYSSPTLRDAYKALETESVRCMTGLLPDELSEELSPFISGELLTAEEKRLLKAADRLSALIKCMEEQRSGNHEFDAALAQQKAALQAMHCPEADWFIEHCLPCYTQNLDELTRQQ
jgi:Predicted hydrolases of HD superfamily